MLADIQIPTKEVRAGEHSFSVRGITFNDIATFVATGERSDIEQVVAAITDSQEAGGGDEVALSRALGGLLTQLPKLAARAIAVCANEPDQWEKVLALPAPVQLDALIKIGSLTFTGDDALKNFGAGLSLVMTSLTSAMDSTTKQIGSTGTKD